MELLTIQSLLQKGLYKIPNYQRGFSWGNEQLTDFFDDLLYTVNTKEHYTGTITIIENERHLSNSVKIYDVVDGHQRLTTISIFIKCCYNRLEKLKAENKELAQVNKALWYGNQPIVCINEDSMEFYLSKILDNNFDNEITFLNKSEEKLFEAKRFFSEKIKLKDTRKIQQYLECILTKFKINLFKLSSESEVGVVFETMNNRGLPLTEIERVKNYLISLSNQIPAEGLANKINENFGIIFKNLGEVPDLLNKTDDDFLRYSLILLNKNFQENDLYNYVKKDLIPKKNFNGKIIIEFVEFLTATSGAYAKIQSENYLYSLLIGDKLKKLKSTGNIGNFIPLLISIIIKNPNQDNLIEVISLLEKFSFRVYSIIGHRADKGQKQFHELAHETFKKLSFNKITKEIKILIEEIGNNEKFRKALTSPIINPDTKLTRSLIYFFKEYEEYLLKINTGETINFDDSHLKGLAAFKEIEIEYIINPNQNKLKNKSLNKLGNLFITRNKTTLVNKTFAAKKNYFKKSTFLLEKELIEYSEWNEPTIKLRTENLVRFALQRWKK